MNQLELRTLRSLKSGPLYQGALELIVGCGAGHAAKALRRLRELGLVAPAHDIGPSTWRITEPGLSQAVQPYSCGSNYCDDPLCVHEHPETL